MSDIVNANGRKVTVIAEREDGVKVALTSAEALSDFFASCPTAKLTFLEVTDVR